MIRVLHVVTYMGRGGLETMLMNYYRHIDRDKIQFDFLVHRDFEADYDKEIERLGGRIYRLPKLVPWSLSYRKALNTFFREHKEYKIVHVHQNCLSSVILKAAKKNNVPVRIAHSHGSNQIKDMKYLIKLYYKRFISKYATDLFACGRDAGNWMFGGESFIVLNNAIDAKVYSYFEDIRNAKRLELQLQNNDLIIGHVGGFSKPKNHNFLIDVFNEICRINTNSKLLLVGDGTLKCIIKAKVDELGLQDKVIFAGLCSNVSEMMQAMDVFLFPSLFEGLGIVAIEAQAAGLPCFISDGVPDEAMITDLAIKIPLSKSAEEWANIILSKTYGCRRNTYSEIVNSGYDIVDNARWLQNYYLDKYKGEC